LGAYIYPTFIYPIIKKTTKYIGIKVIYLYAADYSKDEKKLVGYYKDVFGFENAKDSEQMFIPVTSYYDNGCIFMYQIL
jgi:hypothetical protein